MTFKPVSPQVSFPELDKEQLQFWQEHQVFEKTISQNKDGKPFVFYEGPPTANGMPHPGHVLTRVMKDVFLRFRSMRGHYVPRIGGWDTHGLPVEVEIEKELGISGKEAIEKYGMEAFTRKCMQSVFRYIDEWKKMTQRIGFWVDLDKAYVTFYKSYVESVWWALSKMFEQGLLYQGYKVVWWWPQGGTALSAGEVGQGYKTVDDPSIYVRFKVLGEENTSFLAWTTTPWTLPSNIALALDSKTNYATIKLEDGEKLIVAEALIGRVMGEQNFELIETKLGKEWLGTKYIPPFSYAEPEGSSEGKAAHIVIEGDFVTLDSGTGLVHIAPAFGEDDFRVAKENNLGFLQLVKPDGTFKEEVTDFADRFCKEADRDIIRFLKQNGILFKEEVYRHDYPFCWRKDTDPLIQYARKSWFIRTTEKIDQVIENNKHVHWEPEHIQEGRFGSFLRSNVDWALSRERFWGTPLPIWINDETSKVEAVSSVADILQKNPNAFDAFRKAQKNDPEISDHLMVHKPWIDDVTWQNPGEPGTYRRVPEVIDCWFDSGCMPFAQWGYPHQNVEEFKKTFPADFITEAIDQTRGWFYSLMTISTLIQEGENFPHPFKNCVVLGLISDKKGQKLSKSKKNYTDPLQMIEERGADAVRWALYSGTVPGQNTRFFEGAAADAVREFLLKVWNVYSFFVTYANIDGWSPSSKRPSLSERPEMDQWILTELNQATIDINDYLENYKSHLAARRMTDFVDALSNWYVRRSRNRFWAKENDADKHAAFSTLYEALEQTVLLCAPFVPFVAEAIYQNLVRTELMPTQKASAPLSVHMVGFPSPNEALQNTKLQDTMEAVRTVVTLGQRVRAEKKIKIRQPLNEAILVVANEEERAEIDRFSSAIREELNIKNILFIENPEKYVSFQLLPNFRTLGPKIGKQVPACKKALAEADGAALQAEMESKGFITVDLPDGPIELTKNEIEIRLEAKENFAAASMGDRVVILDTQISDELYLEGLSREIINRIQKARKDLDLPFEARIQIEWQAEGKVAEALEAHKQKISEETLATQIEQTELFSENQTVHESKIEESIFSFVIST